MAKRAVVLGVIMFPFAIRAYHFGSFLGFFDAERIIPLFLPVAPLESVD